MRKALCLLLLLSFSAYGEETKWMRVNAVAESGLVSYVGKVSVEDIGAIASGIESPVFMHIKNVVLIDDRSGTIQRPSNILAGGGKSWNGNELYIRADRIIEIQSMTKEFSKEASRVVNN
ncbi:MAG: hypothetical protein ACI8VC_002591 [Candidatus Endobugula sp.]|jgi:hypothetical protein